LKMDENPFVSTPSVTGTIVWFVWLTRFNLD
jgi:hypothetical protein